MKHERKFVIEEFKTGIYDDITSNPNPDFDSKFFIAIYILLDKYYNKGYQNFVIIRININ